MSFAVVVPFYNEERALPATLEALDAQSDSAFTLVLVDNASTDASGELAEAYARRAAGREVHVVREPVKGTGTASDTGFRYAIAHGARFVARTDADCLPHPDWVRRLKRALSDEGLEFVAGAVRARTDEGASSRLDRAILSLMIWLAERYGSIHRRGPQFRYPYFLVAGNNLAIAAELYLRSGGFPRISFAEGKEDLALGERIRTLTSRAAPCREAIVYNSVRRVRAYGHVNSLRWYRNRGFRPREVDVR